MTLALRNASQRSEKARGLRCELLEDRRLLAVLQWPAAEGGNDHFYEAVATPFSIDWYSARYNAEQAGGHLATLTSAEENAFVFQLVNSEEYWYSDGTSIWGPWLGGVQQDGSAEPGGGWGWTTEESWGYTNWRSGEPNNQGGYEQHLQFFATGGRRRNTWNDAYAYAFPGPGYVIEYEDRYEPNDALAEAGDLGVVFQETKSGFTAVSGDHDFLKFQSVAAGTMRVELDFDTAGGDLDLYAYSSSGDLLADATSKYKTESVEFPVLEGEDVYLEIRAEGQVQVPTYRLNFLLSPADDVWEDNDNLASAANWGPLSKLVEKGLTLQRSDDDAFRFTAEATGNLSVELSSSYFTEPYGLLQLYDQNKVLVYYGYGTNLTAPVAAGQEYFLLVDGHRTPLPEYQLNAEIRPGDDAFEYNDAPEYATDVGSIAEYVAESLTLSRPGDQDYFKFSAARAGKLLVDVAFEHDLGDVDLRLYDAGLNLLAASDSEADFEHIETDAVAGETFFVRVGGVLTTSPRYDLRISLAIPPDRLEPNDAAKSATDLGLLGGERLEASLAVENAQGDYFTFVAGGDGMFTAALQFEQSQGDLDLVLWDAFGNVLGRSSSRQSGESLTSFVGAEQRYYLRVYGYQGATNPNYDLRLNLEPSPDYFEPASNSQSTAPDLGWSYDATLLTLTAGDVDYYLATSDSEGVLTASVEFHNSVGNVQLQLIDQNEQVVAESLSDEDREEVAIAVSQGDRYWIKVFAAEGETSLGYDLRIRVSPLPDALEPNDSLAEATPLDASSGRARGTLHEGDEDFFQITAQRSGLLRVDVTDTRSVVSVAVLDSFGRPLPQREEYGYPNRQYYAPVRDGEAYYIHLATIYGETEPRYTFNTRIVAGSADYFEDNDSIPSATGLYAGTPQIIEGLSLDAGDPDYFTFTADQEGEYVFIADAGTSNSDIVLDAFDQARQLVASSIGELEPWRLAFNATLFATYYVRVRSLSGSPYGLYNLRFGHAVTSDEYESNDSLETAYDLGVLTSALTTPELTFSPVDDDYFRIEAAKDGFLEVAMPEYYPWSLASHPLEALDANGVRLPFAFAADGAARITVPVASGDVVYVHLRPQFMGYGENYYHLEFRLLAPNVAPRTPGDIDGDGSVGLTDFTILKSQFGQAAPAQGGNADLTGDGFVDLADFVYLKDHFGN